MGREPAKFGLIARASLLASVLLLGSLLPSYAGSHAPHKKAHPKARRGHAERVAAATVEKQFQRTKRSLHRAGADDDLLPYAGVASWVDIYNRGPWTYPLKTINRMQDRGVDSIFLQTGNYGAGRAIVHERMSARIIEAAHARGMKVVAWYVPAFKRLANDLHRVRAAIRFTTPKGQKFDSFAMDIEATVVGNIAKRSRRMLILSKRVRAMVGRHYTLGAIIPDPAGALYWPNFPYRGVARLYDIFVPMGYFTYRTSGYHRVHDYTDANIEIIRRKTGDRNVPIHIIGGEADDAPLKEVKAFVASARQKKVLGVSLYDYPITADSQFRALRGFEVKPPPAPKPAPSPTPTQAPPAVPSPPPPPTLPEVTPSVPSLPDLSHPAVRGTAGAIVRAILSL